MNFLTINRYWGDEQRTDPAEKNTANSLQNLLLKIEEKRKRRKISVVQESRKINVNIKKNETFTLCCESPAKKIKIEAIAENETPNLDDDKIKCQNDDFTIISNLEFKRNQKLKRVLPNWLENPSIISIDLKNLTTTVHDIPNLDSSLISALQRNEITHFFPVQCKLIPWLLSYHQRCIKFWPRDVCVSAPTGSGKTLAFVLPIVQILKQRLVRFIRCLVVLPTKDLSLQVYKVFKQYVTSTDLKVVHLGNLTLEKEKSKLFTYDELCGHCSLADIVVTTPGRLVEHLKYTIGFSLSNLKFLVIDEADHVMDSMQNDWLRHLHNFIPPFGKNVGIPYLALSNVMKKPRRPQKLLFSATLSQDPEKISHLNLFQPHLFTSVLKCDEEKTENGKHRKEFVGKFATPAELTEYYTVCSLSTKPLVMYHLIKENKWKPVLCFADSVSNVHNLTNLMQQLNSLDEDKLILNVVEISSKLSNTEHLEILQKFAKGLIDVLITTDNLARGIDLQNVKCVILYDAPKFAKNYIHRIGRTGRAGQEGTSVVLVTPDEKDHFENILNICGKSDVQKITVFLAQLKKLETLYKNSLNALRANIQKEKQNSARSMKAAKRGKILYIKKKKKRKKN